MKFAIVFLLALMSVFAAADDCEIQCKSDYTPVCAQAAYGPPVTFGNGCSVNQYICQSQLHYDVIYEGECIEPEISPAGAVAAEEQT